MTRLKKVYMQTASECDALNMASLCVPIFKASFNWRPQFSKACLPDRYTNCKTAFGGGPLAWDERLRAPWQNLHDGPPTLEHSIHATSRGRLQCIPERQVLLQAQCGGDPCLRSVCPPAAIA